MILTIPHIDEIILRCKKGDERAQMEIYKKYHKAMYNTALRIVKDPTEAEDVMQESFINAFKKMDSFKGTATFGAWLKKIVVNKALSAYTTKTKYAEVSYDDNFNNHVEEENGLDEESQNSEKVKQIMNALNSLKENYRLVLTLQLIEGYDYDEICEILKLSPGNCRTMISRAKESLRKKLMNNEK